MATSATKRPIPLILEDGQIALLDRESERRGVSRSELIRQLIDKGLADVHTDLPPIVVEEARS